MTRHDPASTAAIYRQRIGGARLMRDNSRIAGGTASDGVIGIMILKHQQAMIRRAICAFARQRILATDTERNMLPNAPIH